MKGIVSFLTVLMISAYALSGAENSVLSKWGVKEFFPLIAWDYVGDEATIKSMADCGVTVIAFVPPRLLKTCAKYGIKAIVFDQSVAPEFGENFDADKAFKNLPALIARVNKNPAVYGYHLRDEPGADQFPALGRAVAMVKKLAPGKWPYINCYPGTGDDYVKLMETFVAQCDPTILSYDNYATHPDGSFSWGFWANLADMRQVAVEHNLPFQTIVLTSTHWGYGELNEAHLKLEIFGPLAYGAKGLSYYKFCSGSLPIMNCPDLGNFRDGPLDQFGEKTPAWDILRNLNHQVLNLAPTLLKLHSDEVYFFGDIPKRNHGPDEKSLVKSMPGGDFIVGDFTHEDGSRYVMIVNKDLKSSHPCDPTFNVPVKTRNYVFPVTGELKPFPQPYYYLAPGQGVLIQLKP